MKILQVHKFFTKNKLGGAVTATFEMVKILKKYGHQPIIFSMKDEGNRDNEFNQYFVDHFDLNEKTGFLKKIKLGIKIIYNFEAIKKIKELINKEKPEVAHLHSICHYLSPSIIFPLKKKKIPIVMTLHDYKIICPDHKLHNGRTICEKCRGGKYYHCFLNKCIKNSLTASFVIILEAYAHRFLKSYKKIDLFIAPSYFMKNKCVEFGMPKEKIKVVRNLINIKDYLVEGDYIEDDYVLYFGRISQEKGILDLIKAVKKNNDETNLLIVGSGPEESTLKNFVRENKLKKKIFFLGQKKGDELKEIIKKAKIVVIPSIWYENASMVIGESQLASKPVIVSDLGGSSELIIENKSGLVFKAGDVSDLADKIKQVLNLSFEERKKMGEIGREYIKREFNEEKLFNQLINIYKELMDKK